MFSDVGVWNGFSFWWLIPVTMMILCFFWMRGRRGCLAGRSGRPPANPSAREVLDRRYALGEISREEYETKKGDITR